MADLLALSARFVDEGIYEGPRSVNRVTGELSEVADGVAFVESFSHVIAFRTGDGLVVADTSTAALAPMAIASLRRWSDEPVHTILYTHGHIDHVGGGRALMDEAAANGRPAPVVVGHENVRARFDRYDLTNGYNAVVNRRQFGERGLAGDGWPRDWVVPTTTFRDDTAIDVGGLRFDVHHDKGETDDHAWAWVPSHKAIVSGDFVTWVFPNAGNPQKVQRYPLEWARALRRMSAYEPELLLPAHGLPVAGGERVARVLDDVARALEALVEQTLALMNEGARLDRIVHEVKVPADLAERPYLQATYDEPSFVVRNIWRLYGGWYDGNPANLKPAPDAVVAAEVASLAGGAARLAARAEELVGAEPYLAATLAEMAAAAAPDDVEVHGVRADVYDALRRGESSLMSKGIYRAAAEESAELR